jgi:hypothetical protein
MKSLVAALGAVSLLALAPVHASAAPADLRIPVVTEHVDGAAAPPGAITFTNPLGRSRGVGAGLGRL